uniref:Putative Poly-beta-hydroxybutyrate polymerase n=1 Tax=mine drainage metagenome TaxID=410659 RepID=E6PRA9_9ZZZZ
MKSNTQPRPARRGEPRRVIVSATSRRKPVEPQPAPGRVETGRMHPMQPAQPAQPASAPERPSPLPIQPIPAVSPLAPPPRPDAGLADLIDHAAHAMQARRTLGLSPAALGLAAADWWGHLAASPGKRLALANHALRQTAAYANYAVRAMGHRPGECDTPNCIGASPNDRRFADPAWQRYPFNLLQQAFLLQEDWWREATTGVHGVSAHHEQVVTFAARQWLDMLAPSNSPLTNPEVIDATLQHGGMNLLEGAKAWMDDAQRAVTGQPPAGTEHFIPGREVAATPGKVVLRNRLIELIQYSPSTPQVRAEPVLIVPAWIMKYYILDLSPQNSLVKYLVDQGHTVFMISWKNPTSDDRDLGMDDYLKLGPLAALDAVQRIVPGHKVHAAGYCLGGTLLAIAAAALAAKKDTRLATVTMLASQTDFTEPGELSLFIDESQVSFLEDMMWAQGYLDTTQMAGAFQMLRSYDLIWSRITRDYLLGERRPPNDLMAWNADATRMPFRMHSEYLRGLYLRNDLAEGRWKVDGQAVTVENVPQPWFVISTEADHVAPWRSVYKIHLLADSEITFVLTSGGHNAGIVSEPGHPHRHFRWATQARDAAFLAPEQWLEQAALEPGSWWPRWHDWLVAHGSGMAPPPRLGAPELPPLMDAPGSYVLKR